MKTAILTIGKNEYRKIEVTYVLYLEELIRGPLREKERAKPKIHHKKQEINPILLDAILTILLGGNNMIRKFKVTVDGKVHHIEIEETTVGASTMEFSAPKVVEQKEPEIAPQTEVESTSIKDRVTVPIAGTISTITVSTGQTVKEGDLLFVFEAMKMENEAISSCNGIVGNIYKKEKDSVSPNEVVMEIL